MSNSPATAPGAPAGAPEAAPAAPPPGRLRAGGPPVAAVALSAAAGVLVVATAYTAGRLGYASTRWADWVFWLGEALILVPAAIRLLSRRGGSNGQVLAVVIVLTVAEYLVKVCYEPAMFDYTDELQHWRSAVDLLQTGRLFTPNHSLPVSPYYPGLEEVTTALSSATGLSLFVSGLVVAGTAYLSFACALYALFREISGSHRLAGVAVLVYASGREFHYDNALFVYETLALAFFAVTLLATRHLMSQTAPGKRAGWIITGVLAVVATVVTHHVTSYFLVATLLVIALASALAGHWRAAAWPAGLGLLAGGLAACWIFTVAPVTIGYLWPAAQGTLQGFLNIFQGKEGGGPPVTDIPQTNLLLAVLAMLFLCLLLPVGTLQILRHHRRDPWLLAMAAGLVAWYGDILVRLTNSRGSELAGRGSTFALIPAAYLAALALIRLREVRWRPRMLAAAVLAAVLTMMFDGQANGWPPYWERLPGPYQVAGSERSVTPENVLAASWTMRALGPGRHFASDWGNAQLLAAYGNQVMVYDNGFLFTSRKFQQSDAELAQEESVHYVLVDLRLSDARPVSGSYFPEDVETGRTYLHRLAPAGLTKFNHIAGVSRIYDSGHIVIYDLKGSRYAP